MFLQSLANCHQSTGIGQLQLLQLPTMQISQVGIGLQSDEENVLFT